jgi:restriction system protein
VNLFKRNGPEEAPAVDPATAKAINQLIELPRAEFEQLVAGLYCALGHDARRTGGPGDRDFDLVIVAKSGQHWIVQCKQWRGAVGESVVREFHAAMAREHAAQGAIITTARFTPKAVQWAQGKPIRLYDGPAFLQVLQRITGADLETLLGRGSNGSSGSNG